MTQAVIPVVICIDNEPDDRPPYDGAPEWYGVEATAAMLERWRAALAAATGHQARFSWFWRADPEIAEVYGDPAWGLRRYAEVRAATAERGDAHGLHPHAWRRVGPRDEWVQDRADRHWVEHSIDLSLATFRETTGAPCLVTRMGDRALDWVAYRCLARHGVLVDLSVEPGEPPLDQDSTAPTPDFSPSPLTPYRPRRGDVTRRGRLRRGPTLLPLSATFGRAVDDGDIRLRTVYPWIPRAAALTTEMLDQEAPYLAFAVRSDISLRPELWPHFEEVLTVLSEHPRASALRLVTPADALQILRRGRRSR